MIRGLGETDDFDKYNYNSRNTKEDKTIDKHMVRTGKIRWKISNRIVIRDNVKCLRDLNT